MVPKGVQNLEAVMEVCRGILSRLETGTHPDWEVVLNSIIEIGQDLKTKFFLKTNIAVPITNACLKSSRALEEFVKSGNLEGVPETIDTLKSKVEKLLDGADMGGIVIT